MAEIDGSPGGVTQASEQRAVGRRLSRHADRDLVRRRVPVVLHRQAAARVGARRRSSTPTRSRSCGAPSSSTRRRRARRPRASPRTSASKYGGGADAGRQMIDRVTEVAAGEGLAFDYHDAQRATTVDAHRLLHLAHAEGGPDAAGRAQGAAAGGVLHRGPQPRRPRGAHRGRARGRPARGAGRRGARLRRVRRRGRRRRRPGHGLRRDRGAVLRRRPAGTASPAPSRAEVFAQVLERAWSESQPLVQVVGHGGESGGVRPRRLPRVRPRRCPVWARPAAASPVRTHLGRGVGWSCTASCASLTRSFPIR